MTKEQLIQIVLDILTPAQMIVLKTRLEEVDSKQEQSKPVVRKVVNDDFTVNRTKEEEARVSVPVIAGENTWQDSGEERDGFDKKVQHKKTPRVRPKAVMQTMICSVCQRPQEVPPGLVRKGAYYRCEDCVGGGKR